MTRRTAIGLPPALCAAALLLVASTVALAQNQGRGLANDDAGFFGGIGRWFDRQSENLSTGVKDAGRGVSDIGNEAGAAARSTVDGAKNAAGAVARLPAARLVKGHETCATAPNGAPDCNAAAVTLCRAKGFGSGKSVDMTTAEVCPAQVYLAGRNSGPECHSETFVSSAFCQ